MPGKWDNDFIAFSRTTRRGVLVLLAIFFLLAILPRIISEVFWEKPEVAFRAANELAEPEKEVKQLQIDIPEFDPNKLTVEEWQNLGLTEKQAQSVINFKDKIGGFKDKETVKKAYAISDELFARIEGKMVFGQGKQKVFDTSLSEKNKDTSRVTPNSNVEAEEEIIVKVELNSASFEDLIAIKGIGNYFAEHIIDLRIAKGGFASAEELLEIPYFKEENLNAILPFIEIDKSAIRKLNINKASLKQLSQHPEITWDMAKSIMDLRNELGSFSNLDQLLLSAHIDLRRFKKLENYLSIE